MLTRTWPDLSFNRQGSVEPGAWEARLVRTAYYAQHEVARWPLIALNRLHEATEVLAAIEQRDSSEWRVDWYRGIVAMADERGGEAAQQPIGTRFGFLKAPRSTVLQPGPVHGGVTADPARELERLLHQLVG